MDVFLRVGAVFGVLTIILFKIWYDCFYDSWSKGYPPRGERLLWWAITLLGSWALVALIVWAIRWVIYGT